MITFVLKSAFANSIIVGKKSVKSTDDYLSSLDMVGEVRTVEEADMQRVVQLLAKTNQFNLTTRRHSLDDVQSFLKKRGVVALTLRARDRFGDYGLIGFVIGLPQKNKSKLIASLQRDCPPLQRWRIWH